VATACIEPEQRNSAGQNGPFNKTFGLDHALAMAFAAIRLE
jgi:hypothetical protein